MLGVVTAVVTALVLGAGSFAAYTLLAGGRVALDAQVPADAVAFAEINLDPPAGQKVAAMRFFRHLPGMKTPEKARDLTEGLLEPVIQSPADRQKFAENVNPWLGRHAAVAADPQGSRIEPIVLVEATDIGKARAGLDELARDERTPYGYVVAGQTVVLARTQAVAQAAVDDAHRGSLHGNDTFQRDVRLVGDDGVLTTWVDLSRVGSRSANPLAAGLHGRVVAGLRFTDTAADLTIRAVGLPQTALGTDAVGPRLATLPDDTGLALAFSGADKVVRQAYDAAKKSDLSTALASLQERTGLVLPDDVAALLGSSTVVAIGGTEGRVDLGLISHTDDVDTSRSAAARLLTLLGQDGTIEARPLPDGTVLANSSDYADRLGTPGKLGDSGLFRETLPDLDAAQAALYVDMRWLTRLGGRVSSGPLASVRSLGLTARVSGDTATMRLRMVVG